GLRPEGGKEPGTWRAPAALMKAGLQQAVGARNVAELPRPAYRMAAEPGTELRNGHEIRRFSLDLAEKVRAALVIGAFPLIIGGDCSVLLGALLGARQAGARGAIHIDGHSDFKYGPTELGAAAGRDLALATGRGDKLLTEWPGITGPLAEDADTIQIGEREALDPGFDDAYGDLRQSAITRLIIQDVLRLGIEQSARIVLDRLEARGLNRVWLHVDLDVLDQSVLPAVDSPGSPGLTFEQLGTLLTRLRASGRIAGADICIYDPDRDPERRYAGPITAMLGRAFHP
ncbi:MAG TPA: arginase family protein, partial [Magnetospirillaceae bacterium]|nr:arginase family protein [Magnetospirillaceae bacterium]